MLEWLKDYRKLEDEILYLEHNLYRSKRELKRWISGDLRDVCLTAESEGAKVEEHIEAIEYELAFKMNEMFDLKKVIQSFKELEHKIMYGKYVEGMMFERIAEELIYSTQYIYNKHAEIKRKIEYAQNIS
ncbi:hypothetical protein BK704_13700 [[Bacillus thuringiensis] serovar konkukian]|nr:hypothetical protein [Bacillus thuringiensis]MED1305037.1 hypothetical protein [Bacillus pacificus]OUB07557.1 hypothetical protein BK704_13700 [[Bacillus thuringiensis] serovar konkukian]